MLNIEENLLAILKETAKEYGFSDLAFEVSTPRSDEFGDLSTNAALKLSKLLKKPPQNIAKDIIDNLLLKFKSVFEKIEMVPPGFINFYFSKEYLCKFIINVLKVGDDFARNDLGTGKSVLIEFVSANPTGPLSIAHGRQAAIGNALAKILYFSGYKIKKEYYVNDEGTQIDLLGESLKTRALQLLNVDIQLSQECYQGAYLVDLAKKVLEEESLTIESINGLDKEYFSRLAVSAILESIKKELIDFGVEFDYWSSQKEISAEGKIDKAIEFMMSKALLYEKENALWFYSTRFGDDQDRVIRRSDGRYTYFASDIAYHREKFKKGYDILIDIWGPDHHGYIPRLKAAMESFGYDKELLNVLTVQLATLYRAGVPIKMSTRKGDTLTLQEVIDEIGKDAATYFLLTRKLDSHLDFDIEVAKKQSLENPVYYIQYAYARIKSILQHAKDNNIHLAKEPSYEILNNLNTEDEKKILRTIIQFCRIVKISVLTLEPSFLTVYLHDLASKFHSFYSKCRVITDSESLTKSRLYLCVALEITFRKGLDLLGISAPHEM